MSLFPMLFFFQCLLYRTDQAQDVKKIEKFHSQLMRLMVAKESRSVAMETDWISGNKMNVPVTYHGRNVSVGFGHIWNGHTMASSGLLKLSFVRIWGLHFRVAGRLYAFIESFHLFFFQFEWGNIYILSWNSKYTQPDL